MGHVFSHLSKTDRYKIEALLNQGHTKREIADELHVHISTIYREIKRARWQYLDGDTWITEDRYNPDGAEKRYRENLAAKGAPLKIGRDFELAEYIERKIIVEDRSPAAALAEIRLEGRTFKTSICVSTLYSYITKGVFLSLTNSNLPEKSKRKREYKKVKKTGKRASYGKNIEKRPDEVDQRSTFGALGGRHSLQKKRRAKSPVCADRAFDPMGNHYKNQRPDGGKCCKGNGPHRTEIRCGPFRKGIQDDHIRQRRGVLRREEVGTVRGAKGKAEDSSLLLPPVFIV